MARWATADDHDLIDRYAAFADTTRPAFRESLLRAIDRSGPQTTEVQRAAELLRSWNGLREDRDGDGKYDSPGLPIFRTWLRWYSRPARQSWNILVCTNA